MFWKIVAVASLVLLPFSISLWRKSHSNPEWYRCDLTAYKSLSVTVKDGLIGLHLLSMPGKTNLRSEFRTPLSYDPLPKNHSLFVSSSVSGPLRNTWLIFPLWLSTCILASLMSIPVVRGPILRWHREWRGRCIECAYDLRGLKSHRCPECGTRFR